MEVSEAQKDDNLDKKVKRKSGGKTSPPEAKKAPAKKIKSKTDKLEGFKKLFKNETEKLKKEVDKKDEELKKSNDKFLRLNAEFDNFKKRMQREKADSFKFASERVIRDLIPVLDDLKRAIQSAQNNNVENLSKGIKMIMDQIKNILDSNGAKQFDSLGVAFDPNKHEAVSKITTEEHEHNTVMEELRKGYMFHDRLLRPAMVVVAENIKVNEKKKEPENKSGKLE